jgi:signal transduction histidine kinase/ActR/RegA family two-component response regulator
VFVRFLPDIRYGTENYPEKVARRLGAVNLAAWIGAAVAAFGFAKYVVLEFLDPRPGLWKAGVVYALAASIWASVPLLHRFGALCGALTAILTLQAYLFSLTWLFGTGIGLQMLYLVAAALIFVFGRERFFLFVVLGILAVLQVVVLQIMVPHDTGLLDSAALLTTFVFTVTVTVAILIAIVTFVVSEAEQAEANLAHQHAVVQDKSRLLERANSQLEMADRYKSHFLASASHDLRQPLHALNLFVGQLPAEKKSAERKRLVSRIDAAVASMNELFEALLDMTKLEAGILQANPAYLPVQRLLDRIETTFAAVADKKGLSLRVVPCSAWVRSDPILLERILFNLVGNAVRYTARGGVVVGCRRRATQLRIDVCDTGAGIPEDQRQSIFSEFYQLATPAPDRTAGLGLGLAIVDRLGRLLGHPVQLQSNPGRGSRFSVSVPLAAELRDTVQFPTALQVTDLARGKRVMVIDDDVLVLDGMRGILQSWGCRVHTASSGAAALASVADSGAQPDLIISDLRLADGESGIEVIERLRQALGAAPIPAFVISGDTAPERLREASAGGYHLLQKPVSPMTLRTTLNRLLKSDEARAPSPQASVG